MKRYLTILLSVLLMCPSVFAQSGAAEGGGEISQTGNAFLSPNIDGMSALHYNLPVGSKITVMNTWTGAEEELTVVGSVAQSEYLLEISFDAWSALGLDDNGYITLTYVPPVSISRPVDSYEEFDPGSEIAVAPPTIEPPVIDEPTPVAVAPPAPSPAPSGQTPSVPSDVTINLEIKIISDNNNETRLSVPIPPGTTDKSVTATIGGASTQTAAPPPVTTRIEPESSLVPGRDIRVIPGMPDPNSGKTYRLQVGAYSMEDNASVSAAQLRSGGFRVEREVYNSMYRVLAVGIPARDVYDAVKRIGELGFSVVWVRE